jgi:hypothetical protein
MPSAHFPPSTRVTSFGLRRTREDCVSPLCGLKRARAKSRPRLLVYPVPPPIETRAGKTNGMSAAPPPDLDIAAPASDRSPCFARGIAVGQQIGALLADRLLMRSSVRGASMPGGERLFARGRRPSAGRRRPPDATPSRARTRTLATATHASPPPRSDLASTEMAKVAEELPDKRILFSRS